MYTYKYKDHTPHILFALDKCVRVRQKRAVADSDIGISFEWGKSCEFYGVGIMLFP